MTEPDNTMEDSVLIDTSAWICFFARKGFETLKESIALLLNENRAALSVPILVELIQGCRTEVEKQNLKEALEGVLWYPATDEIWRHAAEIAFNLRRNGVTVSAIDALIATIAIDNDIALLHNDNDFTLISKYTKLKTYTMQRKI